MTYRHFLLMHFGIFLFLTIILYLKLKQIIFVWPDNYFVVSDFTCIHLFITQKHTPCEYLRWLGPLQRASKFSLKKKKKNILVFN